MSKKILINRSLDKFLWFELLILASGYICGIDHPIFGGVFLIIATLYNADEAIRWAKSNTVHFIKVHPDAKIPTKRCGDGCYDLYACLPSNVYIEPGETKLIPTGIASVFSHKYRIGFRERGSNTQWNGIIMAGQIDSNYRGEYFVAVHNGGNKTIALEVSSEYSDICSEEKMIHVPVEEKALCQFAIERVSQVFTVESPLKYLQKHDSERGSGCLGSSGK